jgi:hypothetical protein
VLAKLRDPYIQASEETIRKSLEGNWRPEHVFTLQQSRNSYRHYQEQIAVCDEEIEKLLVAFSRKNGPCRPTERANRADAKRRGKARPLLTAITAVSDHRRHRSSQPRFSFFLHPIGGTA